MKPESVIASRFEIIAKISQRGGTDVYSGVDRESGLPVAIKMFDLGEAKTERFEREAAFLTELSDPGIVRYIAHGTAKGRPFLVMEWVTGKTLSQMMDRGLTTRESVEVVRQVADALAAVHRRGVVHRDVKPSNIMFPGGKVDQVKLLDFGVARRVGQRSTMTRTGAIVGTPAYMSPEQAHGTWDVDARSDVFSLGCVLYACLSGRPAFAAAHLLATLTAILFLDPVSLQQHCPEAPGALCHLLARMLAKDPDRRPDDASIVAAELAQLGRLPDRERRPFSVSVPRWRREEGSYDTMSTQTSVVVDPNESPEEAPVFVLTAVDEDIDVVPAGEGASGEGNASVDEVVASAREIVTGRDGLSAFLKDGTFVAMFAGCQNRTEQISRAARCALSLRELLPEAPMVVGLGNVGSISGVLDRLVETLVEESFLGLAGNVGDGLVTRPIRIGDRASAEVASRELGVMRIDGADYLVPPM